MDRTAAAPTSEEWPGMVGQELFASDWLTLDAALLTQFQESVLLGPEDIPQLPPNPLGDALVDGTYLLSLILHFKHNLMPFDTSGFYGLNYGYNKVRFISQVAVGQRVRVRGTLKSVEGDADGRFLVITDVMMDLEDADKPAMFAETVSMYLPQQAEAAHA